MSYVPAIQDAAQLLSAAIVAPGEGSAIDTTGYKALVAQLTGAWTGCMNAESSNDNVNWTPLPLVFNQNEPTAVDSILENGIFTIAVSSRWIRFNAASLSSGSLNLVVIGRTAAVSGGADMLALAMDKYNNTPLYVEPNSKQDGQKALIASDAPVMGSGSGALINQTLAYIDTTGYQSIVIEFFGVWSANVQVVTTNGAGLPDLVQGYRSNGGSGQQGSVSVNGTYMFPCVGKFIRIYIQAYTSGTVNIAYYLRNQPALNTTQTQAINLATINNTAPVNAGVAGTLAMGGNTAIGVAPTLNPIGISGADAGGLNRRILTDTSGRIFIAMVDQAGNIRQLTGLPPGMSQQNISALPVIEQSQTEGQSLGELLLQILTELKLQSHLIHQMLSGAAVADEPSMLRDPVLFQ